MLLFCCLGWWQNSNLSWVFRYQPFFTNMLIGCNSRFLDFADFCFQEWHVIEILREMQKVVTRKSNRWWCIWTVAVPLKNASIIVYPKLINAIDQKNGKLKIFQRAHALLLISNYWIVIEFLISEDDGLMVYWYITGFFFIYYIHIKEDSQNL